MTLVEIKAVAAIRIACENRRDFARFLGRSGGAASHARSRVQAVS